MDVAGFVKELNKLSEDKREKIIDKLKNGTFEDARSYTDAEAILLYINITKNHDKKIKEFSRT
jgi:hypothetical protein